MKNFTWFVCFVAMPFIAGFYSSCNAEKKVLDSEKKTQNVVNAWLKAHPLKIDTAFKYLPGDTTTTLLINYDTATIHDTVPCADGKAVITGTQVTKTKTVTNTIHDTLKVTIGCSGIKEPCAMLKAAQDGLTSKMAAYDNQVLAYDNQVLEAKRQKLMADGWRLKFWGLLCTIVALAIVYLLLRLKVF